MPRGHHIVMWLLQRICGPGDIEGHRGRDGRVSASENDCARVMSVCATVVRYRSGARVPASGSRTLCVVVVRNAVSARHAVDR
jgi:hypothetical protein